MAVGRITGPLLKANLLRDGVDLAFETDLLYLDVNNGRVGIKTSLPDYDLDVNGTTRSTNVEVTNQADIATFTVTGNTISSSNAIINLEPAGANPVVYQGKIVTGDLQLSTNVIETTNTNGNLNINTLGTGKVVVNSNMLVNGDIHATGNITADGSIQLGDANTDNIVFNADVNSNIIPDDNETWDLGSDPNASGKAWRTVYAKDILATNVTADSILVDGIDLALVQGNIYYVATTGSNSNTGEHEHDPVLTLKYALSLANAGDCIYIFPGVYQEIFPLTVPAGVSVKGAGIRSVKITPTVGTQFNDAFLLNGETTIEDLTIADFYSTSTAQATLSNVLNNPNTFSTSAGDQFGAAVAVSGNYAIVGAYNEDDAGGTGSGKAYIYNVTTGALVHTLNNPNAFSTSASDQFGFSVAISGNYAIVGAYLEDDAGGTSSGKAYIYNVATGALIKTLNNPSAFGTSADDQFGLSVAASGNYAIVGAYAEDDAGGATSGKAYIYDITNTDPVTVNTIQFEFGRADSADGTFTVDLASYGITDPNALVVITSIDVRGDLLTTASEYIDLKLSSSTTFDRYFGAADSSNYVNRSWLGGKPTVVGGTFSVDYIIPPGVNISPGGMPLGYFWQVRLNMTVYTGGLKHILNNPTAFGTSADDRFGWAVAISGNYAIVGAYAEDDAGGTGSGKAYIYNVTTGALVHTLNNPNAFSTSASDQFGFSVAISDDYAIVGAYAEDDAGGTSSGKAYIYTVATGTLVHTLNNPNAFNTSAIDLFGFSVAASGNYAIVGAYAEDDAGGTTSGKAYIFSMTSGQLLQTINNPTAFGTSADDRFGYAVAISGNYAIVGADAEDDAGGTNSGKSYIYNLESVESGYAFRFATGMTVTNRSPYIRNVSVITKGSVTSFTDPYGFDAGNAGKGALADGSVVNAASVEASMLFHSVTFITPNQEAITATNGVRIEWLNSFSYFASKGLYLTSGPTGFAGAGQTRLRIENRTGTWAVGNTVLYYDTDGITVLASGTIASISGNYVNLAGKCSGFETITDRPTKTVYAGDSAKLTTVLKKFGTASLILDGIGDYVSVASQVDFEFGTNDFAIETWVYPTTTGVYRTLFDLRSSTGDTGGIILGISDINALYFYYDGNYKIGPVGSVAQNTWSHVALSRVAGVTRAFVNGVQVGSNYTDSNNYAQRGVRIGADPNGDFAFAGYIDDIRISKGVGRYSSNFATPTSALIGDLSTVLLLHFNGTNNSTTFLDDGVTLQDLRTSAGGTAQLIQFADYSDFGAELRSIGSACVYGNYGAYGDGDGVIAYLISQNFAYVGSGRVSKNDPNDRIAANEVVKLNRAKIYYTSVDNDGNFSVGDAFFVNQKTGDVLFNGESLTITTPAGITFTDGVNSTIITPTNIDTGNIRISGNTVESLTGDVNVTAASGSINLQNNTYITGNLDVTGDITLGGNITIGDANTDTINFVGGISSNLIPATTATYDLGTTSLRWGNVYLSRAEIDGVVIDNNTIQTTIGNDNLTLQANGTGIISIPSNNVEIDQSLTVTTDLTVTTGTTSLKNTNIVGTVTQTGDIDQTGNFTTSGNTEVTGNITGTGYLRLPNIEISGNTITTRTTGTDLQLTANGTGNVVFEGFAFEDNIIKSTATNSNITLTPQGTGGVIINSNQSLILPVGDNSERPAVPTNGMIRYNDELGRYEGYNNGNWLALSGVEDADGNTYITAELTPGANDNTIRFYTDGNLMVTIDSTKIFAERVQTSNLDIQTDTISSISTNSDINLTSTGTGSVRVGNLSIKNNTITNVVSGAITEFAQSSTGYVKISGTSGVVIPSGDDFNRPGNPQTGMMRYNTAQGLVEVYTGVIWQSVAGTGGGINYNDAVNIAVEYVLTFG